MWSPPPMLGGFPSYCGLHLACEGTQTAAGLIRVRLRVLGLSCLRPVIFYAPTKMANAATNAITALAISNRRTKIQLRAGRLLARHHSAYRYSRYPGTPIIPNDRRTVRRRSQIANIMVLKTSASTAHANHMTTTHCDAGNSWIIATAPYSCSALDESTAPVSYNWSL